MRDTIRAHMKRADQLAEREVIRRARKILRDHAEIHEFIMAMGSYSFTAAFDHDTYLCAPGYATTGRDLARTYLASFDAFICKWDRDLRITGIPMRFTATGPIIRNW